MKSLIIIILLSIGISSCQAQKLMQTQQDAYKLVENKDRFIGKPLRVLLAEIRPPIKANFAHRNTAPGGDFYFWFVPYERRYKADEKGSDPLYIRVIVKEPFEWDYHTRSKGKETDWTKEDELKYGNLTVVNIDVLGNVQQ